MESTKRNQAINKEVTMTLHDVLEHLGAEFDEHATRGQRILKIQRLIMEVVRRLEVLSAEIEKENKTTKKLLRKKRDIEALIQASNEVKKTHIKHFSFMNQQMETLKDALIETGL